VIGLAPILLAGCGESGPFPRVDFPEAPGHYVQFYQGAGAKVYAEFSSVDAAGAAHTLVSGLWHGRFNLSHGVENETLYLTDCGVLVTFHRGDVGVVRATYDVNSYVQRDACPLNPLPANWIAVGPGAVSGATQ
jgi:hypothetical protein